MSKKSKSQHRTILLSVMGFAAIIAVVVIVGLFSFPREKDVIQGQVEVTEYRVSSKVAGRIVELRVKEGDFVRVGDTLAILDVPEVQAKMQQAQSAEEAAAALEQKAMNGTRQEQIRSAHSVLQQAQAGFDIAEKSYRRIQHLFDEGVMSAQKRDEAYAHYRAAEAQMQAAQSQYDMAVNGARREDKAAATAQVGRARGAVDEVDSYVRETVQTAQMEGEVTDVYPKTGELVGTGSPIMSIAVMGDLYGTFNVREDKLRGITVGSEITAFIPSFNTEMKMRIYYLKDQGSYAVWKATKANGGYDLKTFEVKARPIDRPGGLRPGMSLVLKRE
jgi:HlyD family secretion protein